MNENSIPKKNKLSPSMQRLEARFDEVVPLMPEQPKPVLRSAMPPQSPEGRQRMAMILRQGYLKRLAKNETAITLAPVAAPTLEMQLLTEFARAYHDKFGDSVLELSPSLETRPAWVEESLQAEAKTPAPAAVSGLKREVMYAAELVKKLAWEMLVKVTAGVQEITDDIREGLAADFFIIPAAATRSLRGGEGIVGAPDAEMVVGGQAQIEDRFDRAEKQGLGWEVLSINREDANPKELEVHLLKLWEPIVYSDSAAKNVPGPKVVPESGLDLSIVEVTVATTQLSTLFDVILKADNDFPPISGLGIGIRTDEEDADKVVIVLAPQENPQIQ